MPASMARQAAHAARSYSVASTAAAAAPPTPRPPRPAANSTRRDPFEIPGHLYFVDRDEEVFQVAKMNIKNQLPIEDHKTLVVAAQMFGAGKTQLAKNVVARAARSRESLLDACSASGLDAFFGNNDSSRRSDSEEWAQKLLAGTWHDMGDAKTVVDTFVQRTGRGIFLHFDEVGALEHGVWKQLVEAPPSTDTDLQKRLRVYYAFWAALVPLLMTERVYLFLTGRAPGFPLVGMGQLTKVMERPVVSPSRLHHVLIGCLSVEDISETLQCSVTYNRTRLEERITFGESGPWRERFLERLEEETAGQPRLVHYFLEGMCMRRMHIDSEAAIEQALRVGELHLETKLSLDYSYAPNGSAEIFYTLQLLSALNVPLNTATMVKVHGSDMPLLALVDKFNLYAVRDQERAEIPAGQGQWLRIRVARCLLRRMPQEALQSNLARCMPPFLLEQATGRQPVSGLGQGEPLEWLVRIRVGLLLTVLGSPEGSAVAAPPTWAEAVPAFTGSAVGGETVTRVDGAPVVFAPKVMTSAKARHLSGRKLGKQIHVYNLQALLEDLPKHKVVYVSDKSAGPDVLLRLESRLLCISCKLFGESSKVTWSTIEEEVSKAAPFHDVLPVTLVIVATQLGREIRAKFAEGALSWRVQAGTEAKLGVPEGMEVLVLSEAGLASLLGEHPLRAIRNLLHERNDPNALAREIFDVAAVLMTPAARAPFKLESFLRDEAKIAKADKLTKYKQILDANDVDEAGLRLLTDAMLLKWGIQADLDRAKILDAARQRTVGKGQ